MYAFITIMSTTAFIPVPATPTLNEARLEFFEGRDVFLFTFASPAYNAVQHAPWHAGSGDGFDERMSEE